MKIAFFTDCYLDLTGGITTTINAEKEELEKRGHTVYVFSSSYPRSAEARSRLAKKNIFPVPSCRLFFRGLTPVSRRPAIVEKWIYDNHPEIKDFDLFFVHYEAGCSIAGLRLAYQFNIPSVQMMHGREDAGEQHIIPFGFRTIVAVALNFFHELYLPHRTKIKRDHYLANTVAAVNMWRIMVNHANCADLVITPSEHFKQKLIHYGVKRRIEIIPNGVTDRVFVKNLKPRTLEHNQTLRIVWHSRISSEKRIMPFLHALNQVNGNYRMDVYGGGGDYFRAKSYARYRDLNVIFHGNTNFESIYHRILTSHLDILVSYNFDTFGTTLVEAESAGTPVFIVDPDMKEVVPRNSYILAKSPSVKDMAKSLNDIFKDPERISKMSEVMLEHRDEVRTSRRVDKLEEIFKELIEKNRI